MKVAVCFLLLATSLSAQNIPVQLSNYLTAASVDNGMNGNILFTSQGKIIEKRSFGYADFGKQIANTDSTLFPLASISKTFTAVAVLQLRDAGKLNLDDRFVKYFPEFPYPEISIRHLLSHLSGLPDTETLFDSVIAKQPDRILKNEDDLGAIQWYARKHGLLFKPGERWSYSSVGFQLLALLVEKISKVPFAEYLSKRIFIPAGMTRTYVQTDLSQANQPNRTRNYQFNNHFEMKLMQMDTLPDWKEWTYNLAGLVGGNNVVSSTIDLMHYDQALYNGKLLFASTLKEAFTPTKLNNGENNKAVPNTSCGLGWFIFNDTTQGKIVWHSGANPGVTTLFARNLSRQECYIVLQNVSTPGNVYRGMLDIITGHPAVYKPSLGFIYGQDMFSKGINYAFAHLQQSKTDTLHYSLTEQEVDRIGLEFSRTKYQDYSLEAYKINTLLFPTSWKACDAYASALSKRAVNKAAAILMYERSLTLNPLNEQSKKELERLRQLN